MFAFVCLYFHCRGCHLGIGYIVATQGSIGLGAMLHIFFFALPQGLFFFFKFDLSYFLLFGPFWAISRVGAMVAGTVGAVWGVVTLSVLVPFLAALCTNYFTVTGGFAMAVVHLVDLVYMLKRPVSCRLLSVILVVLADRRSKRRGLLVLVFCFVLTSSV